jgi:hypothetical protein
MAARADSQPTKNAAHLVLTRGSVCTARLFSKAVRTLSRAWRWAAAGGCAVARARRIVFVPPPEPRGATPRRIVIPDYSELTQRRPLPRDSE